MRISVVGGGTGPDAIIARAEELGGIIAERGHDLVCGGRTGVMAAACRGATVNGGRTIGILPGADVESANRYVDIPVATGIGEARNVLVALNGDGMIAIDGRYGTLSEIAHALKMGRPVAGIETHAVDGVEPCDSPNDAVDYLERTVHE